MRIGVAYRVREVVDTWERLSVTVRAPAQRLKVQVRLAELYLLDTQEIVR